MRIAILAHCAFERESLARELRALLPEETTIAAYDDGDIFRGRFTGAEASFLLANSMGELEPGRRLRQLHPHTPLVLVSDTEALSLEAFTIGTAHYLLRPVGKAELVEALRRCGCGAIAGSTK